MSTMLTQYAFSSPWTEMWQNPEADATVLNAMLISKYGEEALDWDPVTVQLEIMDDYHVKPAEECLNKIAAMQIVMSSSDFFDRIDTFVNVANTLSEGDPFFQVFTPLETEEIAYAVATVGINRDMRPFSPSIRRYVKEILRKDGYSDGEYPEILSAVFDKSPTAEKVRKELTGVLLDREPSAAEANSDNVKSMLVRNVGIMFSQFNSLPGLTGVDDRILEKGILTALGESTDKE